MLIQSTKSEKRITSAATATLLAVSLTLPAFAAQIEDPIRVGSWKGRTLDEGVTSLLILSERAENCTAISSDPAVVMVQRMFGYWTFTTQGSGEATVTVIGPEGRTGSITVTVKPATPTEKDPLVIPEPEPYSEMRLELVRLVNKARRANGVGELTINDALMNAAQICSKRERSWHNSKEDCETAIACGYPHGFGSNITVFSFVLDKDIPQHAVDNWLKSPGHRDTMLDPNCDTIGVGITKSDRGATFCYLFVGNPKSHNPYRDLGSDYYDGFHRKHKIKAYLKRLQALGWEPEPPAVSA